MKLTRLTRPQQRLSGRGRFSSRRHLGEAGEVGIKRVRRALTLCQQAATRHRRVGQGPLQKLEGFDGSDQWVSAGDKPARLEWRTSGSPGHWCQTLVPRQTVGKHAGVALQI
ncbi:MAG: hypothetical protein ABI947_23465 [Chloroflexota bacterium]